MFKVNNKTLKLSLFEKLIAKWGATESFLHTHWHDFNCYTILKSIIKTLEQCPLMLLPLSLALDIYLEQDYP